MSFRPGHGAPTVDNRKKRFTEHQFDKLRHNNPDLVTSEEFRPPPPPSYSRFHHDEPDNTVSAIKQKLGSDHKCFAQLHTCANLKTQSYFWLLDGAA